MSAAVDKDQGLISAALEIAEQRANTLAQLRNALLRNDNDEALSLARELCGLNDKTLHSTYSRFDGIAGGKR